MTYLLYSKLSKLAVFIMCLKVSILTKLEITSLLHQSLHNLQLIAQRNHGLPPQGIHSKRIARFTLFGNRTWRDYKRINENRLQGHKKRYASSSGTKYQSRCGMINGYSATGSTINQLLLSNCQALYCKCKLQITFDFKLRYTNVVVAN